MRSTNEFLEALRGVASVTNVLHALVLVGDAFYSVTLTVSLKMGQLLA